MIKFEMDQPALQQVQQRLSGLAPRVVAAVYRQLKPMLYESFSSALEKYFSGSAPKRGPAGNVLTTRTGDLQTSVLKSFEAEIDGDTLRISAGSDLPYAAIHEYGGFAGRRGPYKKKRGHRAWIRPRPYLRPALHDLEQVLPDLLEQAIQQATANTIQ
jgi:phage gpG-like protein